jgi:uncharacterized protein YhbP (UPF0306 family)
MKSKDEPMLDESATPEELVGEETDKIQQIKELIKSQPFLVLCTRGETTPYGSLIAYAPTEDFKFIYFATLKGTRKYELLKKDKKVALLIDDRPSHVEDMMKVQAVTITGKAEELGDGKDDPGLGLLQARHPYMEKFLKASSTSLFKIETIRFFHVIHFQEVTEWSH